MRPSHNTSMVKSVGVMWSTTNSVPAEFYKLISLCHLKAIAVIMNISYKINEKVLIVMAHIQAALRIIPHIIEPKEDWEPWMCNNLQVKQVCNYSIVLDKIRFVPSYHQGEISNASESSPYSRLLGTHSTSRMCM